MYLFLCKTLASEYTLRLSLWKQPHEGVNEPCGSLIVLVDHSLMFSLGDFIKSISWGWNSSTIQWLHHVHTSSSGILVECFRFDSAIIDVNTMSCHLLRVWPYLNVQPCVLNRDVNSVHYKSPSFDLYLFNWNDKVIWGVAPAVLNIGTDWRVTFGGVVRSSFEHQTVIGVVTCWRGEGTASCHRCSCVVILE